MRNGLMGRWSLLVGAGAAALMALSVVGRSSAEEARPVPAPAMDEPAAGHSETAILAGGCFWGVQGVYQHVRGVKSAVSGYAGGDPSKAQYETVSTGQTGHAESVKVTFDPSVVSYGRILQIFFSAVHDPTTLNRQGPDHGTQYRSAIFPISAAQAKVAAAYKDQLDGAGAYPQRVVTSIETGKSFTPAEGYHQDFLTQNPTYPYIVVNDLPKVAALQKMYPDSFRADPVLVAATGTPSN